MYLAKRSHSYKKSRYSEPKTNKFAQIDDEYHRKQRDSRRRPADVSMPQEHNSMKDMGLLQDGRAIGSIGNIRSEKSGIGADKPMDDVMDTTDFRMNMSLKFHQNIENKIQGNVDEPR